MVGFCHNRDAFDFLAGGLLGMFRADFGVY